MQRRAQRPLEIGKRTTAGHFAARLPSMGAAIDVGAQLENRFTLRAELATRGPRSIYFASDALSSGRHEVHTLNAGADDDMLLEFTREAELLGRIDHPACLSVATVGGLPDGTLYYIVSERSGTRIADRAGTHLPPDHVADVASQLLSALDQIHGLDWRIGWLMPDHVDERTMDGRLQVRIVRMPHARPAQTPARAPVGNALAYSDPRLAQGSVADVASDLYSVGQLALQLATGSPHAPSLPPTGRSAELHGLIAQLRSDGATPFASAAEASEAFDRFCADASVAVPPVPPVPRNSGSRFRTSDIEGIPTLVPESVEVITTGPRSKIAAIDEGDSVSTPAVAPPPGIVIEPTPQSGLKKLWPVLALAAAAGLGVVAFSAMGGDKDQATAPAAPSVAVAKPASGVDAPEAELEGPRDAPGNPARSVALLNRTNLDTVLGYVERHQLLEQVMARPALASRVDQRWNRLLDLMQAADSNTPCSTFRAALTELQTAPETEAERALVAAVKVPSPSTVLGAGVAPDGTCDGLGTAFATATAVPAEPSVAAASPSRRARSKSRPAPRPPVAAEPAAPAKKPTPAPAPSKPANSVSERIDDLKGVGF